LDSLSLLLIGGVLVLIGFLGLIRVRAADVRRRLSPAASIRSRGLSGVPAGYSAGATVPARSLSILLMLGGGLLAVAAIALSQQRI